MALVPPHSFVYFSGWERHTSRQGGALFLHNPTTGESTWFTGWIEKRSKWYGRNYWFQPTTGRAEWDLPAGASFLPGLSEKETDAEKTAPAVPQPSSDKVKSWMAKIKAAKAKAAGDGVDNNNSNDSNSGNSRYRNSNAHKRRREEEDNASSDDMDVDEDMGDDNEQPVPLPAPFLVPSPPPPQPPREDVPAVSVRREELRKDCLERFATENAKHGAMAGYSKTSRSCREEGMAVGLGGMFGR